MLTGIKTLKEQREDIIKNLRKSGLVIGSNKSMLVIEILPVLYEDESYYPGFLNSGMVEFNK